MLSYLCAIYENIYQNIIYRFKENKPNYSFVVNKIIFHIFIFQKKQYFIYFIQKIYKNQSVKLLQCNLVRIIVIKFKNFKRTESLLFQNIFIFYFITFCIYRAIWTQTKKKCTGSLKNMPYQRQINFFFSLYICRAIQTLTNAKKV